MTHISTLRWALALLFSALSVHLALRFMELDESIQLAHVGSAAWAAATALAGLAACIGAGKAIWTWIAADILEGSTFAFTEAAA